MPQVVTILRGPNLSFNLPAMILTIPKAIRASEKAPDVMALVQPNSLSNGFKKTPKVANIPCPISIMRKASTTMK